jgi:hypothetical protein
MFAFGRLRIVTPQNMDYTKCKVLKAELAKQQEPQIVSIEKFFDGNDDLGSIGCNLMKHPGMDAFRNSLAGLLRRTDIQAVYARITELDPGDDCWPFTDTIFIVGTISPNELRDILSPLGPSDVGPGGQFGDLTSIQHKHHAPVLAAWWD